MVYGNIIEPYGRDKCIAIGTNKTICPVTWEGATDLSAVSDKQVRFRFHLNEGSLYSFWVSPDKGGASYGYVAAGGPGFEGSKDTVGVLGYRKSKRPISDKTDKTNSIEECSEVTPLNRTKK